MNTSKDPRNPLSNAESVIEQLVEGGFARLFGQRLHPREVASRLAHAVEDNATERPDGLYAPNLYEIHLNTDDLAALLTAHPDLALQLSDAVIDLASRAGLRLNTTPRVTLAPDSQVPIREVRIVSSHNQDTIRTTQLVQPAIASPTPPPPVTPRNPQLILHGNHAVPLDRAVVNIGRRQTNQIVLDDPRISRNHVQLRLRFGRYVLYDLGSLGGTFVNGQRVTECILRHGDVISLAGLTLVYVEDESGQYKTLSDTQMRKLNLSGSDPASEK